jgi:hypothetical protein
MSHAEVAVLLPLYAVDALDPAEAASVEAHAATCAACAAELRSLEPVVESMATGVRRLEPPSALRDRVLTGAPSTAAAHSLRPGRLRLLRLAPRAPGWLAAAALVVALAGATAAGFVRDAQGRAQLRTQGAALALLTSTETTVDRLEPVAADLPPDAHGHWYHRAGVPTQVFAGELLPPPPGGQRYVVWQREEQTWRRAGELDGSGRLILLGSDGAAVTAVEITRESAAAPQPSQGVVLRLRELSA